MCLQFGVPRLVSALLSVRRMELGGEGMMLGDLPTSDVEGGT